MRHHDFEEQAGRGGAGEVGKSVVDFGGQGGQVGGGEEFGLVFEDFGAVGGGVDKPLPECVGHGADEEEVAHAVEEVEGEAAGFVAGFDDFVDGVEHGGAVAGGDGVDGGVEKCEVRDAQQRQGEFVGQAVGSSSGEQLVEDGQGVARGAATGADDQGVDVFVDGDAFVGNDPLEKRTHGLGCEEAEWVVVGA